MNDKVKFPEIKYNESEKDENINVRDILIMYKMEGSRIYI